MTRPPVSVVPGSMGRACESVGTDWQRAATVQSDGSIVVHVCGGHESLPSVAATSWAIARCNAFEQVVLDLAPEPGAAAALSELGAAGAVRRLDASAVLQDVLAGMRCAAVLVHDDGDASLAAALASARLGISLVRIGASVGDHGVARAIVRLADLQLVFGDDDARALQARVPLERIYVVGNPVVDVIRRFGQAATARAAWRALNVEPGRYVLAVLAGGESVPGLVQLASRRRLVVEAPASWDAGDVLAAGARVVRAPRYVDHLSLLRSAATALTDSSRVRAEAAALGVACHALGDDLGALADADQAEPKVIPLWDGRAGARIARVLVANFARVRLA